MITAVLMISSAEQLQASENKKELSSDNTISDQKLYVRVYQEDYKKEEFTLMQEAWCRTQERGIRWERENRHRQELREIFARNRVRKQLWDEYISVSVVGDNMSFIEYLKSINKQAYIREWRLEPEIKK